MIGFDTSLCDARRVLVLDTAAFLARLQLSLFCFEMITSPRVVDEVKDFESRLGIELIEGLNRVSVREPRDDSRERARRTAESMGLLKRLSETDIDVVALAIEELAKGRRVSIVTDDYSVQLIAKSIGADYIPVKTLGIDRAKRLARKRSYVTRRS